MAIGDFWLDMRPSFFEGFVYVPFKNGKLIADKKEWGFRERLGKKEPVIIIKIQWVLNFLFQFGKRDLKQEN